MIPLYPLHNPGCNDPNQLCAPHPIGLDGAITQEVWLGVLGIAAVALVIGLVQRTRIQRKGEESQ